MGLTPVEAALESCGWVRLETTTIWSLSVPSGIGYYRVDVSLEELMRYPEPENWVREATDRIQAQVEADAARIPRN